MARPALEFWYDFASTYSWLSAVRIDAIAKASGCDIVWRPFLLGPIFKAQGWATSPFNLYPAKGRYMVRDITRIAADRGRACVMPATFPANSLAAARVALAAGDTHIGAFTSGMFEMQFEHGANIAEPVVIARVLQSIGLDAPATITASATTPVKDALRANTARAQELGVFGAPTFIASDGELFWGDDRLEQALTWANKLGR